MKSPVLKAIFLYCEFNKLKRLKNGVWQLVCVSKRERTYIVTSPAKLCYGNIKLVRLGLDTVGNWILLDTDFKLNIGSMWHTENPSQVIRSNLFENH